MQTSYNAQQQQPTVSRYIDRSHSTFQKHLLFVPMPTVNRYLYTFVAIHSEQNEFGRPQTALKIYIFRLSLSQLIYLITQAKKT